MHNSTFYTKVPYQYNKYKYISEIIQEKLIYVLKILSSTNIIHLYLHTYLVPKHNLKIKILSNIQVCYYVGY